MENKQIVEICNLMCVKLCIMSIRTPDDEELGRVYGIIERSVCIDGGRKTYWSTRGKGIIKDADCY